ncbi:acyl dehydratase [Streptomyces canus]|nr:acyl dehydratase [Streptomyces canus]
MESGPNRCRSLFALCNARLGGAVCTWKSASARSTIAHAASAAPESLTRTWAQLAIARGHRGANDDHHHVERHGLRRPDPGPLFRGLGSGLGVRLRQHHDDRGTEEEILRFAGKFDPKSIHTDPEAAELGPFKGLIASGWHTAGIMMRLYADHYVGKVASLASPGADELRWVRPVRPADSLSIRTTVQQARVSRSKPDRGLVHTAIEVLNSAAERG